MKCLKCEIGRMAAYPEGARVCGGGDLARLRYCPRCGAVVKLEDVVEAVPAPKKVAPADSGIQSDLADGRKLVAESSTGNKVSKVVKKAVKRGKSKKGRK